MRTSIVLLKAEINSSDSSSNKTFRIRGIHCANFIRIANCRLMALLFINGFMDKDPNNCRISVSMPLVFLLLACLGFLFSSSSSVPFVLFTNTDDDNPSERMGRCDTDDNEEEEEEEDEEIAGPTSADVSSFVGGSRSPLRSSVILSDV
jgi:hypothetical protein